MSSIRAAKRRKANDGEALAGRCVDRPRGALLFTHFGISGPAVLDVSRAITGRRRTADTHFYRRFFAGCDRDELAEKFQSAAANEGRRCVG